MSKRIKILGVPFDNLSKLEAVDRVEEFIHLNTIHRTVYPANTDTLIKAEDNPEFKDILSGGDMILADGSPVLWASRYLGRNLKETVPGAGLFYKLCKLSAKKGYRVFFLGSAQGVAERASKKLMKKYPGLQVAGTYSPSYPFLKDPEEVKKVIDMLLAANVQILFVGLGNPLQEEFIAKYKDDYKIPVSISIGGTLDFAAGDKLMPPGWVQFFGLAWFFRLIQEPRRLWRRYILDDTKIFRLIRREKKNDKA